MSKKAKSNHGPHPFFIHQSSVQEEHVKLPLCQTPSVTPIT